MISIPKGTKDVLPKDSFRWQYVEDTARGVARAFGFRETRTPVFEHTELFSRGVGEGSDIVTKEMYTFPDKGGRSLTLKPEGTAGAARSFIENGMASDPLPVKEYYLTPAFRYERPQAGRLREFHQFGLEVFGSADPSADAEVIDAAAIFLDRLGLHTRLCVNSIGCRECRRGYNSALKDYFRPRLDGMCPTCRERFEKNPLRILDCKDENCRKVIAGAPKITEFLCEGCRAHFDAVKSRLRDLGVEYEEDPGIVRGLDYYSRTVFEFVSDGIGAQGTVCGGGRYDFLVSDLGGGDVPAVGFAAGIERLLLLMENTGAAFPEEERPLVYVGGMDEASRALAFRTVNDMRISGVWAECDLMARSVKSQLKYADKIGAEYVVIIGGDELVSGEASVKRMSDGRSEKVKIEDIASYAARDKEAGNG